MFVLDLQGAVVAVAYTRSDAEAVLRKTPNAKIVEWPEGVPYPQRGAEPVVAATDQPAVDGAQSL